MFIERIALYDERDHPLEEDWVKEITKTFFKETGHQMSGEQVRLLEQAVSIRRDKEKDESWGGNIFKEVLGKYLVYDDKGNKYFIEIDNGPLHILLRTTGREGYSCESITEGYWKGPFQDLAYLNATAYFYDEDMKWLGRLNLRWCVDDSDNYNIGIDPNIYPMRNKYPRNDKDLTIATWLLLAQQGFLNYYEAETPYIYIGHSDTTASGGVVLPFEGLKAKFFPRPREREYSFQNWIG